MNSLENKYTRLMAGVAFSSLELGSGFSLADFANTTTDEIKELDSLLMPMGTYAVKVVSAQLGQGEAKEGIDEKTGMPYLPLFYLERKYEVLECNLVDKSLDNQRFVGRTIKDRVTFWPSDIESHIGLLKGDYKRVGLPNSGRMGGLEGAEPGWIDNAVDQLIGLKCTYYKQNGEDRARWKWFKLDDADSEAEAAAA